jgi:hypothetical protein
MIKELPVKENKIEGRDAFFPDVPESSKLLIGCAAHDFSASRIAHAVEDVNASLLNLNVTSLQVDDFQLVVALRVNHRNPASVARSLERYGYTVVSMEEPEGADSEELKLRYSELMRYLSL